MPGSLLSIVARWFACHLVLFSLLGFLFAGLMVFGVIDWPEGLARFADRVTAPAGESSAASRPARSTPAAEPPAQQATREPDGPSPTASTGEGAAAAPPTPRKQPKLIGGSLPLYEDPRRGASGDAGGFRPPDEGAEPLLPPPAGHDELLQDARRAYWNGDFETAEAVYLELIAQYPGEADLFGELGNLYQSMGRSAQALDAYFEAVVRLRVEGRNEKLQQVIDLLAEEDDPRVEQFVP